jgi:hypothetical protein
LLFRLLSPPYILIIIVTTMNKNNKTHITLTGARDRKDGANVSVIAIFSDAVLFAASP